MEIQNFIDNLKATTSEPEKQRIIDAYLEEVSREEGILYTIDYHLRGIEQNLAYLEDVEEIKMLISLVKTKLEDIAETHKEKLELNV